MGNEVKRYRVELYTFDTVTGEKGVIKFDEIAATSVDHAINIAKIKAVPQLNPEQRFTGSGTQAKE